VFGSIDIEKSLLSEFNLAERRAAS